MTEEPRWWRWLALLALAAGMLVRAWPWLCEPLLFFEDGTVFFGPNYPQWLWGNVATPYAGYVPFGSNASAMLLCRLPTPCIPTAFVATAALVQLAAGSTLLRSAWRAVAPFWARCLFASVIVLLPIGSHIEFTTLAYMQWPMLCWLFLLLVEPAPARAPSAWRQSAHVALLALLTLSHPLAIVLAPLACLRSVRTAQRLRWLSYAGALAIYWTVVIFFMEDHGAPESSMSLLRVLDCVPALLVRVALASVLGHDVWQWLQGCGQIALYSVAILWFSLQAVCVVRANRQWHEQARTFAWACGWLLLAPLVASFVVRDHQWHDTWIVRYLWLSRVALMMLMLLAVTTLWPRWLGAVLLVLVAVVLTYSNGRFHSHGRGGEELRQFVERLHSVEQSEGGRVGIEQRLSRAKQPPIVIRPR